MGKGVINQGCKTTTGGVVLEGVGNVPLMSSPITTIGMEASCPDCRKGSGIIQPAAKINVFADGNQIALDGDIVACGYPTGSNKVIANPGAMTFAANKSGTIIGHQAFASKDQMDKAYEDVAAMVGGRSAPQINPANMYWPPYNPTTGEDLTEKLKQALEANHQQTIIFTQEDAAQTLKSLWEEKGTDSLKAMDKIRGLSDNGYAIYKTYEMVRQFGDLGVIAKMFTSKGNEYIALTARDNSGKMLKHVLVNNVRLKIDHKYRIDNPKVVQLGLTPQSRTTAFKGSALITLSSQPRSILMT